MRSAVPPRTRYTLARCDHPLPERSRTMRGLPAYDTFVYYKLPHRLYSTPVEKICNSRTVRSTSRPTHPAQLEQSPISPRSRTHAVIAFHSEARIIQRPGDRARLLDVHGQVTASAMAAASGSVIIRTPPRSMHDARNHNEKLGNRPDPNGGHGTRLGRSFEVRESARLPAPQTNHPIMAA